MKLRLEDFEYDLPKASIAKFPPKDRGASKLLQYKEGAISHHSFKNIAELLPKNSLLVFNDTKVIPARVIMHKDTGARIELFLLEPVRPSMRHEQVMNATESCTWKCMIGNAKKWSQHTSLSLEALSLKATRTSKEEVTFTWKCGRTFSDLLAEIGKIPLPPYLDREATLEDQERYQTVYARSKGAVAAPTAGLHFTEEIITKIKEKGITIDYVTLHVSAGTFLPIKSEKVEDHPMHNEQIWVSSENIENLLDAEKIIAVGTTSMRTLESLYWYGAKLRHGNSDFNIQKDDPYQLSPVHKREALEAVWHEMKKRDLKKISGQTEIFLYPGYQFRMCDGLITNYHLPGSTLVLLVAAFIGADWKKVYHAALQNDYQFLSYGDSSLLFCNQK